MKKKLIQMLSNNRQRFNTLFVGIALMIITSTNASPIHANFSIGDGSTTNKPELFKAPNCINTGEDYVFEEIIYPDYHYYKYVYKGMIIASGYSPMPTEVFFWGNYYYPGRSVKLFDNDTHLKIEWELCTD